ncbi:MAG: zinc metallopeptidase [Saprospiraceae bacterium]
MMMGYDMGYMVIAGIFSVIGMYVSGRLKAKFNKYSKVRLRAGMSGKEIAEAMLQHYNINDVKVVQGKGMLTDHYNPATKTVSLSPAVYQTESVAAAAVAAHECGHAVQHATAYSMLQLRSRIVPLVQVSAQFQQWALIIAFVMLNQMPSIMLITIGLFAVTALFSFITLPVEFDASKRALAWLQSSNITSGAEQAGAKDALFWAAMTYVASALSAFVMVLYLVMRYMSASRN